jgi:hypothetical protein
MRLLSALATTSHRPPLQQGSGSCFWKAGQAEPGETASATHDDPDILMDWRISKYLEAVDQGATQVVEYLKRSDA